VALGALAIVALPGLATARDDGGESSATIKSFDRESRTLVVSLPDDETVTGLVTRRTKIRCEDESGHRGRHGGDRVRLRDSGPGNSGSGEAEPGDDRGGREAEPGDDRGGHGNEPGDDNGGGSGSGQSGPSGNDDNGRGANCTTADLIPGAAVDEVELDFDHGGVRFDEVELDD